MFYVIRDRQTGQYFRDGEIDSEYGPYQQAEQFNGPPYWFLKVLKRLEPTHDLHIVGPCIESEEP